MTGRRVPCTPSATRSCRASSRSPRDAGRSTARSYGFALQRQGRAEEALRLYDDQLRRNPDQPALYLTRASLCPHFLASTEASRHW